MKLTETIFAASFRIMPGFTPVSNRLFADGAELDPETAIIISGLPRHIWDDIGVTDMDDQEDPVDNRQSA